MSDKAKFETGTYSADDILDWYDENTNETYINSLKKSDKSTFDEVIEHEDDGITYEIGTVNGVSVILGEKKKPEIFGQNIDTLKAAGDKSLDTLQATPGFLADMLNPKNIAKGMNQGVVNAFQLVDSLTGGSVTKLDNYFTENFPNTLGKKIEYKQPEGAGGVTGSIIGQYVVPGIGLLKLLRGSVLLSEPLLVGAFSSKDEGNMASLFKDLFPDFTQNNEAANIIINGLIANEDDSEVIGRLKNIAADSPIAFAFEGIFKIYKSLYKNKEAIEEIKSVGAAATPKDAPTPVQVVDSSGQPIKQADQVVQSEKPFYSNVEKTISNFTFKQQPGNQILATLNNTAGIKQSEIQDLGLDTFLKDNPSVTKEQLDDFIADKSLTTRVNDTMLEGSGRQQKNDIDFITRDPEDNFTYNVPRVLRNAQSYEDAKNIVRNDEITYAELLDYVAAKNPNSNVTSITDRTIENFLKDEFGIVKSTDNIKPTKFGDYVTPGGENYKEMLITAPGTPQVFTDHHFRGEVSAGENLIAHARFNDRTIDGNKILFIEEIQSDLHQAGRKLGYRTQKNLDAYRGRLEQVNERIDFYTDKVKKSGKDLEGSELDEANELLEERGRLKEFLNNDRKLVADAPFKKNWYELTMKRLIKYAIDNGYDGIAFTTGEMQVLRYPGMQNPEGLKGFYDNTLTKFTTKFGNKYGAELKKGKLNDVEPTYSYSNADVDQALDVTYDAVSSSPSNPNKIFASYKVEETGIPGERYQLVQIKNGKENVIYSQDDLDLVKDILADELDGFKVPQINKKIKGSKVPLLIFPQNMKNEILTEGVPIAQVEERENKQQTTAIV
tara:strand:+ start:6191 stop:8695 length:2505 start_codon:yes stop_codon:yes gene_type:complete